MYAPFEPNDSASIPGCRSLCMPQPQRDRRLVLLRSLHARLEAYLAGKRSYFQLRFSLPEHYQHSAALRASWQRGRDDAHAIIEARAEFGAALRAHRH